MCINIVTLHCAAIVGVMAPTTAPVWAMLHDMIHATNQPPKRRETGYTERYMAAYVGALAAPCAICTDSSR
jgi:hypothetical protein